MYLPFLLDPPFCIVQETDLILMVINAGCAWRTLYCGYGDEAMVWTWI